MIEIATFGAGCFWGIEAAFMQLKGVIKTSVGYMGGHFANPCYLDVCARITGHAEVVQVEFELSLISYQQLLDKFWDIHDPTSLNRQGPDRGEQYRSVIFYHSPAQRTTATTDKLRLEHEGKYDRPIVTQIEPASEYYLAEAEHQQYFAKRMQRKSES
jgi:peptide-methionine (S)-S-oxide reductase